MWGVAEASRSEGVYPRAPAIQSHFIEPIWERFCALLPERDVNHPLGCHRSLVPDQVVFEMLVQVLVFGCAYWRIADESCSRTLLCAVGATNKSLWG
jgi:hypothetical protein